MATAPYPGLVLEGPNGENTVQLGQPKAVGSYGVVYLAKDTIDRSASYAVKFPHQAPFSAEDDVRAFRAEMKAAETITHPNVVRVLFTSSPTADLMYLVMELATGGTLQEEIDRRAKAADRPSSDELRDAFGQLVDGIEAVNTVMLHRDVKPSNIMIEAGRLKIGDFGLAKLIAASTRTLTFKGSQTPEYMAPEGWNREDNDLRLDMYAMGIVFFELAALEFPFKRPSLSAPDGFRLMHLTTAPGSLRQKRPDLPVGIAQVVARMLEKRQEARFPSWLAVRQALETSWSQASKPATSPALGRFLAAQTALQAENARKQADAADRKRREDEQTQVEDYQWAQLKAGCLAVFEELQAASHVAGSRVEDRGIRVEAQVGAVGSIKIELHRLQRRLELEQRGSVRCFVHIHDDEGVGFNVVLLRAAETDPYGVWQGWEIANSPIIPYDRRRPVEPFPLMSDAEFVEHFPHSEGVMYVYMFHRIPDVQERLRNLVAEFCERRLGQPR